MAPSQVLITNGGKHAVAASFETLLDPGDEVLVPAPYWTTYPEAIALAGGRSVDIATGVDAGFRVSIDQLEAARTDRTKVLLLVSPVQPHRSGVPAGGDRSHRALGPGARFVGHHR